MESNTLHEAALRVAIRKGLIRPEETYAYPAADARETKTSYVIVSKRHETSHRLMLTEVQKEADRHAARESRSNINETADKLREAFEISQREEANKRLEFRARVRQLAPIDNWYGTLWGLMISGSGGFMLFNALGLNPESSIHQIYQVLGVAGGLLLVGLGRIVVNSYHQSVLLGRIMLLLHEDRRRFD